MTATGREGLFDSGFGLTCNLAQLAFEIGRIKQGLYTAQPVSVRAGLIRGELERRVYADVCGVQFHVGSFAIVGVG